MNSYHQQRQGDQQFVLQHHQMQVASQGAIQDSSKSSLTAHSQNNHTHHDRQHEPEMWAQKVNYADQHTHELVQQNMQQNIGNGASLQSKNRRGSNVESQHSKPVNAAISLDLNQNIAPTASHRHGATKQDQGLDEGNNKRGGFFGQGIAESSEQGPDNIAVNLNKTQVIQNSSGAGLDHAKQTSNNERANRINLHRSNRQRSHQGNNPQGQDQTVQYYEKASKNGHSGVPEVKIQLKNGKQSSDLDVVYYQGHPPESTKNSTQYHHQLYSCAQDGEDQFYQTQKTEGTQAMIQQQYDQQQNFKQSQQNNKVPDDSQQYPGQEASLQNSKQQLQQQENNQLAPQRQHAAENHHRRGSDAKQNGINQKKKVQPPQPRGREESSSRRSGQAGINIHNKSSETTNSYDQSSQNSSTGLQQTQQARTSAAQQQPQAQQINTDKFSQLVCQVPQGANQPQMSADSQSNPLIQVQDGANGNFNSQYLLGPQRASEAGRKTLVLDLDETLVHSSFKPVNGADIMLPVEIDGQICTIYVLVRPFVAQFLKRMHKIYELVIFTASLSKYAEPLMEHLDPQKMCSYLLFREHCTFFNNAYVKDLTRLGRPMKDVIIVDNSPVAYLFQPENAMPAVSWYDEPSDTELNRIDALLHRMVHEDDVRKIIRTIIQNNKIDPRQEQLYMASAQHRRDKSQRVDRRTKQSTKLHQSGPPVVQNSSDNQAATELQNKARDPNQQVGQNFPASSQSNETVIASIQPATANSNAVQPSGTHSRYDSSDTRQRNAALISEEINQRKRGDENNVNMEIVLSNVQKLTQQASDLQYQSTLKKGMHQNQNDIQQAYQHHKNQILQLKNEIAALKSQQTGKTPRASDQQANAVMVTNSNASSRRVNDGSTVQQQQVVAPSSTKHAKTTSQVQRVAHQQIGDKLQDSQKCSPVNSGNKGQKQREGSKRQQEHDAVQNVVIQQQKVVKPHQNNNGKQTQQRQSYKILSTNEIQLVNYLKSNTNGQPGSSLNGGTTNQRHSINVNDKKQLVVRESAGNNSQLHNTKQIIKLIKKSEGHQSNQDVTGPVRQNYQQIEGSSQQLKASQPNIQSSNNATGANYNRQSHPATTKSQTKQHFAFTTQNQGQPTGVVVQDAGQRQVRQPQQSQPFSGQINMIQSTSVAARGQQASRTSSKTTKNYSTSAGTANTVNIRTSYSSSKHGAHANKAGQSSLQAHERMSANGVGGTTQTKRSSSVKNNSQGGHHVRRQSSDKDHHQAASTSHHNHRKGNNSATQQNNSSGQGYSNLGAYETTGHRRERGSSAQPLYGGISNHGPNVNPLLVANIVSRSSSTTNKNKKVNSISGAGNFHNLVLNGSHSTKHSTQQAQNGHNPTTQQILQANSQGQQRGGSQDRHQQKTSTSRQPMRIKSASGKSNQNNHHGSESKDEHHPQKSSKQASSSQQYTLKQQQEQLQRMQQMQQQQVSSNGGQQQLSATQRISPGTMLNLASQYGPGSQGQNSQQILNSSLTPSHHQQQAQAIVKNNLKDIQVQDMLKLTQGNTQGQPGYFQIGISSTRNQKQVAQIGGHHSVQQQETDDFLKKVKLQQQTGKGKDQQLVVDMSQKRNTDKVVSKNGGTNGGSNITIMHQEGTISKSSQGHQSMGQVVNSLTINSPKYANGQSQQQHQPGTNGGSSREQQKILNDIMNMSSMQREQKSGSAATSYATKQIHHMTSNNPANGSNNPASGTNGHQIKKIRISSNQQNNTGRISGQSNQSAPNHHKSSGLKRGDSNNSRGSHSSAIHQVIRTNGSSNNAGATTTKSREQARQAQLFNQTMKLKDSNVRGNGMNGGDGIISLLGDMAGSDSQEKDLKNQTAADLFLKSHNEEQFSQTQYIGSAAGSHLGHNQLREVTRHFYNQISQGGSGGGSKKQHHQQAPQ